jgi:hypothetical protein
MSDLISPRSKSHLAPNRGEVAGQRQAGEGKIIPTFQKRNSRPKSISHHKRAYQDVDQSGGAAREGLQKMG